MDAVTDLTFVQPDEVNLPELWRRIQEVRTRIPTIPFPMVDVGIDEGTGTSPERKSNSLLAPPPASASGTGFPRLVVVQPTPTCNIDCNVWNLVPLSEEKGPGEGSRPSCLPGFDLSHL